MVGSRARAILFCDNFRSRNVGIAYRPADLLCSFFVPYAAHHRAAALRR